MAQIYKLNIPTGQLNKSWLPDINQLDSSQQKVLMHSFNSDLFVMGSAGTGKTILAKLKYDALRRLGLKGKLVIYGNIFKSFLKSHIQDDIGGVVGSFELPRALANIRFNGNFNATAQRAADWAENNRNIYDFLIIDEVQDLHEDHIIFCSKISKRLYLFGDNAQQFFEQGRTIEQIIGVLSRVGRNFGGNNVTEITKNYRNQPLVAKAAQPFYAFSPSTFPAASPEPIPIIPNLFVSHNYSFKSALVEQVKSYIRSHAENTSPTIGILTQSISSLNFIRREIFQRSNIEVIEINSDNAFSDARPVLMTMQSSKGMEFDYVILVDINYRNLKRTHTNNFDKIIFVAITRARRSLSVFLLDNQAELLTKFSNAEFTVTNLR